MRPSIFLRCRPGTRYTLPGHNIHGSFGYFTGIIRSSAIYFASNICIQRARSGNRDEDEPLVFKQPFRCHVLRSIRITNTLSLTPQLCLAASNTFKLRDIFQACWSNPLHPDVPREDIRATAVALQTPRLIDCFWGRLLLAPRALPPLQNKTAKNASDKTALKT